MLCRPGGWCVVSRWSAVTTIFMCVLQINGKDNARWHLGTIVTLFVLASTFGCAHGLYTMDLVYTWGTPTFVFLSDQQRQQMQENGSYIPGNSVPFDIDIGGPNGSRFISMPAMLNGTPVTLATIQNVEQRDSPQLVPYPDWSWHAGSRGCDGLTSVFRIEVDRCGRLWVIDSGIVDVANTFRRQCPPQLLVFNLTTDELLVRHRFDTPQATCLESLLISVAVEQMGDSCSDDAFAYVADTGGFALFVYSLRSNSSWRVPSELFYPDVNWRRFRVASSSFLLMDGVLGMALSPLLAEDAEDRLLFFHSTTSNQEGVVRTSILRNQSLFADGLNSVPDEFQYIGRRKCQSGGEAMSSNGVLFYSPFCANTIMCWNSQRHLNRHTQRLVERDDELLRFVVSVKVLPRDDDRGEDVWAVANNAQLLFAGTFQANVTNAFNIVRGSVRDLLAGTRC